MRSTSASGSRPTSSKRTVDFSTTAPGGKSLASSLTATDLRIVNAVQNLQNLVNTESKWRNRVVSAVSTSTSIDISAEKMADFIAQCEQRIAALRQEVVKIAEKQLLLVSFDPAVYKQWFEQLGSDPSSATAPPLVVAAHAAQSRPGTSSGSGKRGHHHGGGGGGGGGGGHHHHRGHDAGLQVLDNIQVPEGFWARREQQKNALVAVFRAVFDLPRLHRERHGAKPSTAAEMLFHLKEATRLSASGPGALKELLQEYRAREKDIAAGIIIDPRSGVRTKGANSSKGASSSAASGSKAGGGRSAGGRPATAPATGGGGGAAASDGITMKSCLQTGIFLHDPSSDELAMSTDLRPSDFFDIGSPRCLDQRVLHRVMTLRSRKLRLEECISVFQDERAQLLKRQDLQKEVMGLGQYSLFAVRPLIEQTAAEEKALQRQRAEELMAEGGDLGASRRFGGGSSAAIDQASPARKQR